ncbi:MAG: hypothetical protein ACP5RP_03870 [Candidatus Micrarchaeia archaeon]
MDLFSKIIAIAVILGVILGLVVELRPSNMAHTLNKTEAVQIVLKDLYSNATNQNDTMINIINTTPTDNNRSWIIYLYIVHNYTKPCPDMIVESFNYPSGGLLGTINNMYTNNCNVYNISKYAPITSPYIAIAYSYNKSITPTREYVARYGYKNVTVTATKLYLDNSSYTENSINGIVILNKTSLGLNDSNANAWLVNYTATNANYSQIVVIGEYGGLLEAYKKSIAR